MVVAVAEIPNAIFHSNLPEIPLLAYLQGQPCSQLMQSLYSDWLVAVVPLPSSSPVQMCPSKSNVKFN